MIGSTVLFIDPHILLIKATGHMPNDLHFPECPFCIYDFPRYITKLKACIYKNGNTYIYEVTQRTFANALLCKIRTCECHLNIHVKNEEEEEEEEKV